MYQQNKKVNKNDSGSEEISSFEFFQVKFWWGGKITRESIIYWSISAKEKTNYKNNKWCFNFGEKWKKNMCQMRYRKKET